MKFKKRNLRAIAECVIGDNPKFPYRSSSYITQFFEECELNFEHDGSTRWSWTSDRLEELLRDTQSIPNTLPSRFVHVLRVLMQEVCDSDKKFDGDTALTELNKPLKREGYEAFYGDDQLLYLRHLGTKNLSIAVEPHRPFTSDEVLRRYKLSDYLNKCSEDELIEGVLLPLFRQLGFHRITATGHKDKALEYGKDIWMRYSLPTQHILYFGLQVKKGKIDSAGSSRGNNSNISEIYNQVLMMIGHEIFDPETNKKVLVDHAFIVAGAEITKQAKNWLGGKLDANQRSQILFMDREDILDLFVVTNLEMPKAVTELARLDINTDNKL
ncbi:MAG: hypothetical protein DHS20C08_02450 [Rhodomicrobium sp.]|nr:MAG: hypothetical protein DHS20C08_02450 [Rhodomicrobium sp.]